MVGTRASQDAGNEETVDHKSTRQITDPTFRLQEKKRLIKTPEQLDSWMTVARHLLLEYLEFCRQKAQAQSVADEIKKSNQKLDNDLRTNWAFKADVQNGEIYDQAMQAEMVEAMKVEETKLSHCHKRNVTTQWHTRYQEAQIYWEDFLYYQNQWNRRICGHQSLGDAWADLLVELYNTFEIGARNIITEAIGADLLHRYPVGVRSRSSRPTFVRRQHLKAKFPYSAVRLDHDNIQQRRHQVDNRRWALEDFDAKRLPDSKYPLKPYHAATAREWRGRDGDGPQTSWEIRGFGGGLGDAVSNLKHIPVTGSVDGRPRYKTKEVKSLVRTFVWNGIGKGKDAGQEGSGENKQFLGHYIDTMRHERHFVLDLDGHRIEEDKSLHPIKLSGPSKYEVPSSPNKWNRLQGPGRRDRASLRVSNGTSQDWRKDRATSDDTLEAEFSDDEHTDADTSEDEPDTDLEGLDGDSDDERDLFTLSYQGMSLPGVNPNHRLRHMTPAPDDETSEGETDSQRDSDDDNDNHIDSEEGAGPMKSLRRPASRPTSNANGERISQHEPRAAGETFEAVPGNDDWDLATYTHTFPDGTIFTQRTLVPAFKDDVDSTPGTNPPRKVYPANGSIPAVKGRATAWKNNSTYAPREDNKFEGINGRWDNGDYQWVPTVIARSFRLDNNGYFGYSINPHFDAIMKGDKVNHEVLQKKHVRDFNKVFNQVYRRSDRDIRGQLDAKQFGAWAVEELNVGRNFARSIIQSSGAPLPMDDVEPSDVGVDREPVAAKAPKAKKSRKG